MATSHVGELFNTNLLNDFVNQCLFNAAFQMEEISSVKASSWEKTTQMLGNRESVQPLEGGGREDSINDEIKHTRKRLLDTWLIIRLCIWLSKTS